jgi:hypothetical protein
MFFRDFPSHMKKNKNLMQWRKQKPNTLGRKKVFPACF